MSGNNQPRVPAGNPNGGQYGSMPKGEPTPGQLRWAARGEDLEAGRFVPAITHGTAIDPRRTSRRKEWWDSHFSAAQWGAPRGDYPKMPDDYTPGNTGGQALSGGRRTHRMRYESDGVSVRMPSKTSIRRFAKEGHRTFDVPYSVTGEDGKALSGWARVSGPQNGLWDVQIAGNGSNATELAAREIIHATLEGRRPSVPVSDVNAIIEQRRREKRAAGAPVAEVKSTWIDGTGFAADPEAKDGSGLMVMTTNGKKYGYKATFADYKAVRDSRSPGATFTARIKKQKERINVEQCPSCQWFSPDIEAHRCQIRRGDVESTPSTFAQNARGAATTALGRFAQRISGRQAGQQAG